jgi:hypothetical protein
VKISAILGMALLAACGATITPRGGSTPTDPGRPTPQPDVGTVRPGVSDVATRSAVGATPTKTICRSSPTPGGFVAIDYLDSASCTAAGDSLDYNAKIVADISGMPIGSTLRICADQRVPTGWDRLTNNESSRQCPRRRTSTAATTVDIRRER